MGLVLLLLIVYAAFVIRVHFEPLSLQSLLESGVHPRTLLEKAALVIGAYKLYCPICNSFNVTSTYNVLS